MFNIHKSSNLQHVVKHLEVASCKCRAAEPDAQALRGTWCLPHTCTMPLEQGAQWNTPAEARLRQRESCTSLISPGPEPWLRWMCEGEGSRRACSSATFCSKAVCAQGTIAEHCQGQMPARRETSRIERVALLLCTVERLKHKAFFHVFVFKVTIKGRDDSSALII